MRRAAPWFTVALSALVALVSAAAFAASLGAASDAHAALEGAEGLHEARLAVAAAQRKLGGSSIEDAIASADRANATAESVGAVTERIARLLSDTEVVADRISGAARRGLASTAFVRRQTGIARDILATIAAYQARATHYSDVNNRALRRILIALRRTNEDFPGGAP